MSETLADIPTINLYVTEDGFRVKAVDEIDITAESYDYDHIIGTPDMPFCVTECGPDISAVSFFATEQEAFDAVHAFLDSCLWDGDNEEQKAFVATWRKFAVEMIEEFKAGERAVSINSDYAELGSETEWVSLESTTICIARRREIA